MTTYDFEGIERKWQKKWLDSKAFEVREDPKRPNDAMDRFALLLKPH